MNTEIIADIYLIFWMVVLIIIIYFLIKQNREIDANRNQEIEDLKNEIRDYKKAYNLQFDENKLLNKQYTHCILSLDKERNVNSETIRSLREDLIELRTSAYDFALNDHKLKEEKNKLEKEYEKKIQKRVFDDIEIRELLNKIFKILQISEVFYRSKCNIERIELILHTIDARLGEGSKTWFKNYTELYNKNKLLKEEIKNIKKRWWE